MVWPIILVGVGGFIGAILRYIASGYIQQYSTNFPIGTFFVNFVGSFILSFIMFGSQNRGWFDDNSRIFLTIGLLGSFTTMSTFNYETFKMIEDQRIFTALINIFANVVLGLFAVIFGRISSIII